MILVKPLQVSLAAAQYDGALDTELLQKWHPVAAYPPQSSVLTCSSSATACCSLLGGVRTFKGPVNSKSACRSSTFERCRLLWGYHPSALLALLGPKRTRLFGAVNVLRGVPVSNSSTMASAWHIASSRLCRSSGREDVSVTRIGMFSVVVSGGNFVGGRSGGGRSGKDSVAAAVIREVFPTLSSPITVILIRSVMSTLKACRVRRVLPLAGT